MNIIRWISVIVLTVLLSFVIWKGTSEEKGYQEVLNTNDITNMPLKERVLYPLELTDSEWEDLSESYQYFQDQGILAEDTWVKKASNHQLSLTDVLVSHQEVQKGLQKYIQELQEKNMKHTDQINSLRIELTELQESTGKKKVPKDDDSEEE